MEVVLEVRVRCLSGAIGDAADDDEGDIAEAAGIADGGAFHFCGQRREFSLQPAQRLLFLHELIAGDHAADHQAGSVGGVGEGAVKGLARDTNQLGIVFDYSIAVR